MTTALLFLTYLGVILLIGLITSIISKKFNIPNILLLLLIGILLGKVKQNGEPIMVFSDVFLTSISILALVMIIFDSSSRFSIKEFDAFSLRTFWLSFVFLVFNLLFLTLITLTLFDVKSILFALVFSALMAGTDPAAVLTMLKGSNRKVFEFLKIESLLNTPLTVLLPFIILEFNLSGGGGAFISTLI